jgi:hypothetical protein
MTLICKIVRKALATGYLTVEAEEQLQMTKYGLEDFDAFITLQKEVMEGRVKQQALELLRSRKCSAIA